LSVNKSLELDDIIKVHGSDFTVLAGTVEGLLDFVFGLSLFVFREFQVVFASFVKVQEVFQID
jgi:hypothetical protein